MVQNQTCKKCKTHFSENAPERNYSLYKNYGFANEKKFRQHNSNNKRCPLKMTSNYATLCQEPNDSYELLLGNELSIPKVSMPTSEVEWGPYVSNISMSEEDYIDNQQMLQIRLKKHNRTGELLWFNTSEESANAIQTHLLNSNIQFITLVAEPGSGKTAVMHCLTYTILKLPYHEGIHPECITFTTGMADNDWYNQFMQNFKLKDNSFILETLYTVDGNFCVTHRANFHKRITWLLNHPEYISNAIFIIDEHHIADESDMTIDNEFKRLGLTLDKMKEYNIKIILVSATPDVNLSIMSRQDNHEMVILQNGKNYKGFEYYMTQNMIIDYPKIFVLETMVRKHYSTPRYHFIRARTQQSKGTFRSSILETCQKNDWTVIEDDSDNNYYISFKQDDSERTAEMSGKSIIRTYVKPLKHTIILIKNKYPASKRLKLTSFTGFVIEKPSDKMNTTITCNGLIPRFWGYDELPEFPHGQKPIFICNKKSVDEYINFKKDFVYNGKSYTSNRIKSDEKKTKELTTTAIPNLMGIKARTTDSDIETDSFDSLVDVFKKLQSVGFTNVREIDDFNKGPNGYQYPRRSGDHNSEETRLTKEIYLRKFADNGGGSHINRRWNKGGSGQPYMIWPVYETMQSPPDAVKYYVHYLKLSESEN